MTAFKGSNRKTLIRKLWCTPLLRLINNGVNRLFYYLGFPGPKALDVLDWRDLLHYVCAFERPSNREDQMEWLTELEENLILTGLPFDTYFGLIEQVMIWGRDLNAKRYSQDALVTLYQLDFCQALTAYIPEGRNNLRYQAFRGLFDFQSSVQPDRKDKPFVIFLTVRDEIHVEPLNNFIDGLRADPRANMLRRIRDEAQGTPIGNKLVQHPALKAFVYICLCDLFIGRNIRSLFLPPVSYMGNTVRDPMVVYTILGTFDRYNAPSPMRIQSIDEFIQLQGFRLEGENLVPYQSMPLEAHSMEPDNAIRQFVGKFLSDPIWSTILDEVTSIEPPEPEYIAVSH